MVRRFLCGLGLSLGLSSCVQDPQVPKIGEDPISITLSLSSLSIRVGQPDTLRVVVANKLPEAVRLTFSNVCQVYFTIRDQAGGVVTPRDGRAQCVPQRGSLSLPVGGTRMYIAIWTGGFDFVPLDTPAKVPPGTYFVSAQLIADGYSALAPAFRVQVAP